jgi:hypothetical protein
VQSASCFVHRTNCNFARCYVLLQSESVAAALTAATVKLLNLRQQLSSEQLASVLAARVGLAVKSGSLQALLSAASQLIASAAGEATLVVPIGSLLQDMCTTRALPPGAADDARYLQVLLCCDPLRTIAHLHFTTRI